MAIAKSMMKMIGVAALGVAAFEAGHALPQIIQTYRAATSALAPLNVQNVQWPRQQKLPITGSVTPSPGNTNNPPGPSSNTSSSGGATPISALTSGSSANSFNWAGVVQVGNENSVQATWTAPTFNTTTTNPNSSIAEWVGLGGMQSNHLIQIGTITTPNSQGAATTTVFWERLPRPAIQSVTVPAGSTVTAQIVPDGGDQWRLMLTVQGQVTPLINKIVTLTPRQAAQIQTSADWITEEPTTNHGLAPLAPVPSTTMTNVKANGVPFSQMSPSTLQTVGLYSKRGRLIAEPVSTSTNSNAITVDTIYGNALPAGTEPPATNSAGNTLVNPGYGNGDGYGNGGYGYSIGGGDSNQGYNGGYSGGYGYQTQTIYNYSTGNGSGYSWSISF